MFLLRDLVIYLFSLLVIIRTRRMLIFCKCSDISDRFFFNFIWEQAVIFPAHGNIEDIGEAWELLWMKSSLGILDILVMGTTPCDPLSALAYIEILPTQQGMPLCGTGMLAISCSVNTTWLSSSINHAIFTLGPPRDSANSYTPRWHPSNECF